MLALLLVLLFFRKAKPGTMLFSAVIQLVWTGAAAGGAYLVVSNVLKANNLSGYREILKFAGAQPVFYAMLAVSALGSLIVFLILSRLFRSPFSVALGVLIIPAVLAVVTTFVFPSVNYLFALPVLAGLAVVFLSLVLRPGAALFGALGSVLILLLFLPIVMLMYVALSFESAHMAIALAQFPLTMIWGFFGLSGRKKTA
jgi:hypothetical protein